MENNQKLILIFCVNNYFVNDLWEYFHIYFTYFLIFTIAHKIITNINLIKIFNKNINLII